MAASWRVADHPGLIDHHDRSVGKTAVFGFADESGEGGGGDPGGCLKAGGGAAGQRPTQDGGAGDGRRAGRSRP